MRAAPAAAEAAGPPLGADNAVLAVFALAAPLLATLGGGRAGLPSTLDAGTVLAMLAGLGPACAAGPLSGRDRTALALAALTFLALDGRMVGLGLTAAGLAASRRASRMPRALAGLWLAVAAHVLWAPLLFRFVGRWLIALEMPAIGLAARLAWPGVVVEGARLQAPGGWSIYVLEGCSAFAGLSAAALVWYAALTLRGVAVDRHVLPGLLLGLAGVAAVNVARIVLMLPSPAAYAFWHDGPGGTLVVAAGVVLGAAPALATAARR